MAISSGSYTVGSGGTYASWTAAIDDLTTLAGNVTLTQISDITQPSVATIDVSLAGYTLLMTSNKPHYGVSGQGWQTDFGGTNCFAESVVTAGGVVEFANLWFNRTEAPPGTNAHIYLSDTVANTIKIHDCFFNDNRSTLNQTGGRIINGTTGGSNRVYQVYNCIFYDSYGYAGYFGRANAAAVNENNTLVQTYALAGGNGFYFGTAGTHRNCCSFGATNCYQSTNARVNCASSDTTGSTGLVSLTLANEFISTVWGNPNFLMPTIQSKIRKGGVTPTTAPLTDMMGRRRPDSMSNYSCGAMQFNSKNTASTTY